MKKSNFNVGRKLILLFAFFYSITANAQVIITSTATAYTQNFNTLLATAGTSATLPTGWKLLETGTSANTTYASDAGTTATGNTYSYGTGTSTDRAFGALLSGSLSPTMGVQIKNSTTQTITSITISYTGEQWRCGTTGRTDQLNFQYSTSATSLSTGTWVDVNTLDFISPSTTSTGAKDGNAAANRAIKTTTITGLNIASNATFWLRWEDADATGADDGLSIDDFSIQLIGGDVTPPIVSTINPANNATGIALNGNLVVTFNENIQKGTIGNIVVKRVSDAAIINTAVVTAASITVSGASATIPFTGLAYSTAYYVELTAGTFKDIAGNSFAGIIGSATWSFTTIPQPAATVTDNPTSLSFGFIALGAVSANKSFTFTTSNITAALALTAPNGFQISRDGVSFTATQNYTIAEAQAGQTVFVRFTPTTINTNYSGLINFSSTGLLDNKVQLTGNSNVVAAGPLNFYFGNLHAHSSYSDGNADDITKIPADNYAYAKTALCFDFLGLSEHNHVAAGMHLADWAPGIAQATAATTSTFVALHGMEWGTISGGGHAIVYGMDSLVGWDPGENQIFVTKSVYTGAGGLFDIINRHGSNALAYLAHPNTTDYNGLLNGSYDLAADNAIVGTAVESGPAFSINTSYTDPATSMSYLTYYKNMLSKGYHVGPTIDHDNHNFTFGHTAKTRLVVMAASLSENNLLDAMRRMRFYASEDCGARINYTINTEPIGSILTKAGAPTISVGTITTNPVSSVIVMYGVAGSGVAATQLTSSTSGTFTFTDNALTNLSQRYYYLDITETDGSRIITAPIWYTRNDAALFARNASSLTSFFAVNETDRVILKWTTENESTNQSFEIERSIDGGKTYKAMGTIYGKGASDVFNSYGLQDMHPYNGVAYYRLLQKGKNGIGFTDIKVVDRSEITEAYYTIYPNPVHGILNVKVTATTTEKTAIEIYDIAGRRMITQQVSLSKGGQNISLDMTQLQNGSYILKLVLDGKTSSQMVNKF
jgi:Bacterial Ig-like domain/Secretion system C-terminal sorting domain